MKELFPDVFSEDKLDWEKLKATFSEDINFANERYVLNWAGKADAFKTLQIPTTATLIPCIGEGINDFPQFEQSGKSFNPENHGSDNVFIEGENLEVLKVLQKSYYGKIKCIIIDPPYNTGNDSFIYPDSFKENKADYEKRIGDKDEEGYLMKEGLFRKNSKDSGHFHSNWLSMMYPRLFLAKNLLKDDGVIFVHIDDNEVHNLRLLMNEIFGEENFVAEFIWKSRQIVDSRTQNGVSNDHEYILVYGRNNAVLKGKKSRIDKYKNPDNDERGSWMSNSILGLATPSQRPNLHYDIKDPETGNNFSPPPETGWRYSRDTMTKKIKEKRIVFPAKKDGRPREKKFLSELESEYTGFSSLISTEVGYTLNGTRELRDILDGNFFPFPKPISIIKTLINQGLSNEGTDEAIVLDFFAGSATTAQAVLELNKEDGGNRKFILVQLPELTDENSEAFKAGYKTIADISKERIRRVINKLKIENEELKIKKEGELKFGNQDNQMNQGPDNGFKVFKLASSNFKIWRGNEITEENLAQQLEVFTNPVSEGSEEENMLYELMIKAGYELTDKIEKADKFYSINDGELIIALEEMSQPVVDKILAAKPQKVITLDNLFTSNDQLKTNTVLQMRDAGVEFKTI
ncbi:MAG TPA: site-specific DNA-methyltransferase [Hanamia sp.]|nr:site-specific DNA-methyltransferase [Hanamia sp.]